MTGQDIGDEAAFARPYSTNEEGWHREAQAGLTKREWLAGLVMQGELACESKDWHTENDTDEHGNVIRTWQAKLAERAVACADALLAELAKEAS